MTEPEVPPLSDEDIKSIADATTKASDMLKWELEMRDKTDG